MRNFMIKTIARSLLAGVVLCAIIMAVGCSDHSSTGGGHAVAGLPQSAVIAKQDTRIPADVRAKIKPN